MSHSNSQRQLTSADAQFAQQILQQDQIKTLNKKMNLLKNAIRDERGKSKTLEEQISGARLQLQGSVAEIKKKEEKNEALQAEIKQLKEALIVERNQKMRYMEELEAKERELMSESKSNTSKMSASNYFGLGSMFK